MNPIATHQPVLFEAVRQTTGSILELGAGDSSTRQLHEMTDRYILTVDDQMPWLAKYGDIANERHGLLLSSNYKSDQEWGLVFIDSSTWDMRLASIKEFKDKADIVVIHDGNYGREYGVVFGEYFKYWCEYRRSGIDIPTTIIASNRIDVREIRINDTIKVAES